MLLGCNVEGLWKDSMRKCILYNTMICIILTRFEQLAKVIGVLAVVGIVALWKDHGLKNRQM